MTPQQHLQAELRQAGRRLQLQIKTARALSGVNETRELRRLIERVPFALLVLDDRQRYVEANREACRLLGYTRTELLELSVKDVVAFDSSFDGPRAQWRQFMLRRFRDGDVPLRRADQEIVVVSYWAFTNVLPGLHVSILAPTIRSEKPPGERRLKRSLSSVAASSAEPAAARLTRRIGRNASRGAKL